MNLEEIRRRLGEIREGLRHLAAQETLDEQRTAEFDWLEAEDRYLTEQEAEAVRVQEETQRREQRREEIRRHAENHPGSVQPGTFHVPNVNRGGQDPFDLSGVPAYGPQRDREARARALTVVQDSGRFLEDRHREQASRIIDRVGSQPGLAELTLLRSSETYADAFLRSAFDPDGLSPEERQSLRQVKELQRAMSLSDVTGVLVPAHLDPSLILSNDGTVNPFRAVCRTESGTTNVYQSVSSAGVTASYDAEAAEVSDDAPSFSNPVATAHTARAFVPISIEAFEDARGRESEIVALIQDAKDRLESEKFAVGSGSGEPRGLITALDANTNVEVANTTSNTFGLEDVYNLYENLPARWRNARTSWFAHLAFINDIRQFGTEDYHTQTVQLGERLVPGVLGHPILESSEMDSAITAGGTENILVVGDPQQFLLYDRIGLSVELIPHLFATGNNRPSGQRGWFAHWRSGSNTTVDTAFRVLQAET